MKRFYKLLRDPKIRKNRYFSGIAHRLGSRRLWIPCRTTVSHGLAIGLFFSMILPLPFQGFFAAYFAVQSRANIPFAMLAVWISNPLTVLPLAFMQERLGFFIHYYFGVPMIPWLNHSEKVPFMAMNCNVSNLVVGMVLSGVLASVLAYPIVHVASLLMPDHIPASRNVRERDFMRKQ